jgi:hypothetical protein
MAGEGGFSRTTPKPHNRSTEAYFKGRERKVASKFSGIWVALCFPGFLPPYAIGW